MKNSKLFRLLTIALAASMLACQSESPSLVAKPPEPPPPPAPEVFEVQKDETRPDLQRIVPQLDILFVIDDSLSMDKHQKNLADNINSFVAEFSKDQVIDFHIGVTPVYDSIRFGQVVPEGRFNPLGHLLPVKGATEKRFIERNGNFSDQLTETLKVGVPAFKENGPDASGSQFEESFSPVVAVLDLAKEPKSFNFGFRRPGAHLVVVLVTDANDSSQAISADWLAEYLWSETGDKSGGRLTTVGVIIPSTNKESDCKRDPSGAPSKIEKFLSITRGLTLDLCSKTFGDELADIGKSIRSKLLNRIEIPLNRYFQEGTLIVKLGTQVLNMGANPGWVYNSGTRRLVIQGLDQIVTQEANASLTYEFTAVDLSREKKHTL